MKRWPKDIKERAYLMHKEGMTRIAIAAYLSEQTGRPCNRKTVGAWIRYGVECRSQAKFGKRWHRRAKELRADGVSYSNIAAIIAIESGMGCAEMTVYGWLNPAFAKREIARRRANERRTAAGCC